MRWQCSYRYAHGIRCIAEAEHRIHFNEDHPFDHVDVCTEHLKEYPWHKWIQRLRDE